MIIVVSIICFGAAIGYISCALNIKNIEVAINGLKAENGILRNELNILRSDFSMLVQVYQNHNLK